MYFIVKSMYSCSLIMYLQRDNWHSTSTLFLGSCKTNARVYIATTGSGLHSSKMFVLFYVLFVCTCVLYYCHRVSTQLQLRKMYQFSDRGFTGFFRLSEVFIAQKR